MTSDLRHWITLCEAQTYEVTTPYGTVRVWENATASLLKSLLNRFGELRGLVADENFWVWNAENGTHHMIAHGIDLDAADDDLTSFILLPKNHPTSQVQWADDDIPRYQNDWMIMMFDGSDDDLPQRLAAMFAG